MSILRQGVHVCPSLPSQITTLTYEFPHGQVVPEHLHPEDQLVYACRGVMTVLTSEGAWVVPAQRAVWIPARTPHSIVMSGAVSMRTLYLRAHLVRRLPRSCCVVNVSPLLQELILHACKFPSLKVQSSASSHRSDCGSVRDCAGHSPATAQSLRSQGGARGGSSAARSERSVPTGKDLQDGGSKQADDRKAFSTGD